QSTYTRPVAQPDTYIPPELHAAAAYRAQSIPNAFSTNQPFHGGLVASPFQQQQHGHNQHSFQSSSRGRGGLDGGHGYQDRRRHPEDRPKKRFEIPGCSPWVLVKTKLGRRFVHNTESGESFWKFPEKVMKGVIEFDRLEREKKTMEGRGDGTGSNNVPLGKREEQSEEGQKDKKGEVDVRAKAAATASEMASRAESLAGTMPVEDAEDSSDEYEEVEVTDDEEEDGKGLSKRQRTDSAPEDQPVEFNEDDIAYQLAAMGEDHGLDPGEYGDGVGEDWEEGAEGLPLTEEDTAALFRDMLDDHNINPYTTWESLIEGGRIIEDDRYTAPATTRVRKEIWSAWTRDRIAQLREQRENQEKKDPRIPYLAFLQKYATPKLYWPEFKRKYKKEAEMRDTKVSDKERERWYREHINRLKLPQSTLGSDLVALLKSLAISTLNRSTSMAALPPALLTDMRYLSLTPDIRDPLIELHISTLPPAPVASGLTTEEEEEAARQRREKERRAKALEQRERRVEEEKRRQERDLSFGRGRLREEEMELQRAMTVGKEGLRTQLGYLEGKDDPPAAKANLDTPV
ncbi:hypothetical protein B0A49_11271, partial [Cryomyces minteri]